MASIEVKQIASSCKTRMRITVSVYEKYANHCLRIYSTRSVCSVLHVCMTRKGAAYAYRTNLWLRQHTASVGLVYARMNVSAGLSDANTTLSPRVRLFPHCSRRRNISSRSCHRDLWAALRSQGRQQSMLPGGRTFCKKNIKGDVKNLFWPVMAVPLAYLQVLANHFGREI